MFDGRDLDAADRWVDDWQAKIEERAAQAVSMSRRIAELSASARSVDGLVEVTVGASGQLTGLRLDDEIRRRSAARTAQEIMTTLARAQAVLAERAAVVVEETMGADSETGRAVIASFAARQATMTGGAGGD